MYAHVVRVCVCVLIIVHISGLFVISYRFLITSGDAPTILQPGFYYNALHIAVLNNQLPICQEIFKIICSDSFWEAVYSSDSLETREMRMYHLMNLYLNRQTGRPPKEGQELPVCPLLN